MLESYEIELPTYNIEEVYQSEYQAPRFGGIGNVNKPKLWLGLFALGAMYLAFLNKQ